MTTSSCPSPKGEGSPTNPLQKVDLTRCLTRSIFGGGAPGGHLTKPFQRKCPTSQERHHAPHRALCLFVQPLIGNFQENLLCTAGSVAQKFNWPLQPAS